MNTPNLWAVLASTVASIIIGSIWYGPMLFGKKYMQAVGMDSWTPEKREKMRKAAGMSYFGQTIASAIMFYVLSGIIVWYDKTSASGGAAIAFWMWLGFIFPTKLGDLLWGGNKTIFWLSIGGSFITLLVGGAIIGVMN